MTHRVSIRRTALAAVALGAAACGEVVVTAVDPAHIEISPAEPVVKVEETVTLSARVLSREGRTLSGRSITWRSTDSQVALVDSAGTVTGVTPGTTHVHAASGDAADSVLLTVEPPDPSIALAPALLSFAGMRGAENPDAQDVQIANAGGRTLGGLTVTVVYAGGQPGGWITTDLSGDVAPATLTIAARAGTLAPGTYTATVNVASAVADNSPQAVAVTFELADALPAIGLGASTASFAADVRGADPQTVTIDVVNAGGRTLGGLGATVAYPAGQQTGWLSATLAATTAPTSLALRAATGALPVGTHTATVRVASSGATNSPVTITATFVVREVAPGAPSELAAVVLSSSQVDLEWQAASGTVDEYRLQQRTGTAGSWSEIGRVGAAGRTWHATGLAAGTQYTWRVRACNAVGCSPYGNEVTATTHPLPPGTPGTLGATVISAARVDLAWGASSGVVAGYDVERRTGTGAYGRIAIVTGATTFQNTGLAAETGYTYRVRACNAGGCSAYGNEAVATTLPDPPSAPSLTATAVDATSIDLGWSGATGTITEYRVERVSPAPAIIAVLGALVTAHRDIGLSANTAYTYRVQACNQGGCSAYSNEAGATTLP